MDVYFRSCPRDVRVTTLIFIPFLNTKMSCIVLEKVSFFGDLSFYTNQTHAWRIQHQTQVVASFRALPSSRLVANLGRIVVHQSLDCARSLIACRSGADMYW